MRSPFIDSVDSTSMFAILLRGEWMKMTYAPPELSEPAITSTRGKVISQSLLRLAKRARGLIYILKNFVDVCLSRTYITEGESAPTVHSCKTHDWFACEIFMCVIADLFRSWLPLLHSTHRLTSQWFLSLSRHSRDDPKASSCHTILSTERSWVVATPWLDSTLSASQDLINVGYSWMVPFFITDSQDFRLLS